MRQERLLNPKSGGCMLMAEAAFDEGYNGLFFILESKFMNLDSRIKNKPL